MDIQKHEIIYGKPGSKGIILGSSNRDLLTGLLSTTECDGKSIKEIIGSLEKFIKFYVFDRLNEWKSFLEKRGDSIKELDYVEKVRLEALKTLNISDIIFRFSQEGATGIRYFTRLLEIACENSSFSDTRGGRYLSTIREKSFKGKGKNSLTPIATNYKIMTDITKGKKSSVNISLNDRLPFVNIGDDSFPLSNDMMNSFFRRDIENIRNGMSELEALLHLIGYVNDINKYLGFLERVLPENHIPAFGLQGLINTLTRSTRFDSFYSNPLNCGHEFLDTESRTELTETLESQYLGAPKVSKQGRTIIAKSLGVNVEKITKEHEKYGSLTIDHQNVTTYALKKGVLVMKKYAYQENLIIKLKKVINLGFYPIIAVADVNTCSYYSPNGVIVVPDLNQISIDFIRNIEFNTTVESLRIGYKIRERLEVNGIKLGTDGLIPSPYSSKCSIDMKEIIFHIFFEEFGISLSEIKAPFRNS